MKYIEKLINKFFPEILIISICFLSVSTAKSQPALTDALDYDGNGAADFAVLRPENNYWYAAGGVSQQIGVSFLDTPAPGDYDGDGRGDIAVWRESNGTFINIQSSNGVFVTKQFGTKGDEPVARDYDGDGKTDCAVVRRNGDNLIWYILQSSNNLTVGYYYGADTDRPAPGDYDGDGIFDIAVHRQFGTVLIFYINQSTEGQTAIQFGYPSDLVVPGDYDGDGKTDIAVVRWEYRDGDTYEWYYRQSSNGIIYNVNFGAADAGDIPAQGDYDGNGATDIAVWRNTTNASFYFITSSGQGSYFPWGRSGDLPIASYDTH